MNDEQEPTKPINPNLWGLGTGVVAFILFAIAHFTIGFPDMLIHAFILPIVIGLLVRWQFKLEYTNPYRDE